MMKKFVIVAVLLLSGGLVWYGVSYFGVGKSQLVEVAIQSEEKVSLEDFVIEEVANGLFVPWSIVFTDKNRMLFTERNGNLREIVEEKLNPAPILSFPEVSQKSEEGLMGLAVDPEYDNNKYLYVSLAYMKGEKMVVKVQRLLDKGRLATVDATILDDIPAAQYHAGSRLRFGPDGMLYVTTGDATKKEFAQDPDSLAGKILRMDRSGENLEIFSSGHRNPQGIDWDPNTGKLWSTEHGPSLFDGPAGGDEVNIVEEGKNYGWPIVSHENSKPGLESPIIVFTPAVAPASGIFFRDQFYFGALRGEAIYKVTREGAFQKLPGIDLGRIREVAVGPDDALYFSTSNKDGRGELREKDDKIYRLVFGSQGVSD